MVQSREKLLVLAPIPPELRRRLSARFDLVDYSGATAQGGYLPTAPGFRVAVTTSMAGASAPQMAAMPDLGLIACNGAGLERIDLVEAQRRGVIVCHTPDVVTEDTADFAIALMFAAARRIAEADRFVRAGRWGKERMTPSRRLHGKTVGIVGLGKIGSAIARRVAGIGMHVAYTGPRPKPGVSYRFVPAVAELAELADVLILSCPGGEATRNLIDGEVLKRLGPEGILVNVARGSVVDEPALIDALSRDALAGAGLDVFGSEPDLDPAFLTLENVVLQPHYAAVTREGREGMADVLENAVGRFLAGEPVQGASAGDPAPGAALRPGGQQAG